MSKRAVVFGSSGQLGVELVRELNARGFTVHGFERKAIDIGDFISDDRRFRALTGWVPRTSLDAGLLRSLDYYRRHLASYV